MTEWLPIDEHTPRDGRSLGLRDPALGEVVGSNSSSAPTGWAANLEPYLGWPDDEEWRLADDPARRVRPTMWRPMPAAGPL